ncbi:hypothetical protein GCM10009841_02890 [Microlunatus panaciterrae]|uniref:Aminoglycoside phosphotransferase (APT) family kinase protein n=1 Tax=Microlunatus panaciterrae TaxID=400768 RepID=A0ABS2RJ60_9ACTN|nr:aminoglycoside phosphotransferase family protein [Microlunatus panaciterrae]MBM7799049.1 aminoglycoside phosphotransferase (APT) family kinase protein [Microlunatus panaciterrae]
MSSATVPQREFVVALTRAGRVLTAIDGDRHLLPRLGGSERWPGVAALQRCCGDPAAVVISPVHQIPTEPMRSLYVLAGGRDDPGTGAAWLRPDDPSLAEPAELLETLRQTMAESSGSIDPPPDRPDWFRHDWLNEADCWIDLQLQRLGRRRSGPSQVIKIWSLSAVIRTPTEGGAEGIEAAVYFKATCDWFRAEPRITGALARFAAEHLPPVLEVHPDRPWMLMDPLPGVDTVNALGGAEPAVEALAQLQLASLDHRAELEAAGCPDRSRLPTIEGLHRIVHHSIEADQLTPEELAAAAAAEPWLAGQVSELYDCGLPTTIAHGDLHLGNVAFDNGKVVLYDWTDACFSHPFLDAAHLVRDLDPVLTEAVLARFAAIWRRARPAADIDRALELAPLVNRVFQAISYEGIYRAQEEAARWELGGIVASSLRQFGALYDRLGGSASSASPPRS